MNPEAWIALAGVLLTFIIFSFTILRTHANRDIKFQEESGRDRARMDEKIKHLEDNYETLHQWKNVIFQQIIERQTVNLMNVFDRIEKDIDRRLVRIEKHLNGKLE